MATARIERRLAAILAADVVGYSRIMERDEAGTFARLKRLRQELVEPVIARQGGRVVDLKGDGAMVEFHSVVAAVEAAAEIQRAMLAQDPDLHEAERIRYRIGINLGEVIVDGRAIYGDGVNVAARIEGLCEPGGIWLSRAAYDQVKGKVDLAFAPTGQHHVKNISEPVETFRVALEAAAPARPPPPPLPRPAASPPPATRRWLPLLAAATALLAVVSLGGAWQLWPGDEPAPKEKPGVAVLPFTNMGGDDATGRLADGITEDVITDLARFRDFDVIARNSTEVYKGKPVDIRRIGTDLNVGYVLEGSIQRQADRVRVTAQLIDARSGTHVWSERWDRPAEDVFAVQADMAEHVANRLGGYGLVAEAGRAAAQRKRPGNLTAYDLYMLGVEAKHRMTPESTREAVQLLKRAIELDPRLARAWTALSWVYTIGAHWAPDAGEARRAALDAARCAVQLDPTDADARAALGVARGSLGDLAQAEVELEKALQLNPNHTSVLTTYANWASSFGEPEKGAQAAERLIRLDPHYPVWAVGGISYAFFITGRYEAALRALARQPQEMRGKDHYVGEAVSLAGLGRVGEAAAVVAEALARFPGISAEALVSRPDFTEHDRRRLIEGMRAVGFPVCAKAEELVTLEKPVRLPECEADRAKANAVKS